MGAPAAQPPAAGSGVSPAGVTTSVNAAPSSLEEEYYQACRAAADWMTGKHDGPDQLVEGYPTVHTEHREHRPRHLPQSLA
ncbi:lipoprotein LpqV [Mycobacteroides abscessus]|uniref:lipoprotein LpqV n=1 Tax=Mycobacteroides abscessus TaxID=36809 RepID=UPI0022869DED|nr:lipoprotein LpqV [Mycobacteroides abscessus]